MAIAEGKRARAADKNGGQTPHVNFNITASWKHTSDIYLVV
jgi:hypothetical protein